MRLIILTPPADLPDETQAVCRILEHDWASVHLRKPDREDAALAGYLERIPGDLHRRIMIHDHLRLLDRFDLRGIHFTERRRLRYPEQIRRTRRERPDRLISSSFHQLAAIPADEGLFDYLLLSPVFDSISKKGYRAAFPHHDLQRWLSGTDHAVVALGGIDAQRITTAAMLGFQGVAVLGAVWASDDPMAAARRLARICRAVDGRSDQTGQTTRCC